MKDLPDFMMDCRSDSALLNGCQTPSMETYGKKNGLPGVLEG